jgi:hypothetical protein
MDGRFIMDKSMNGTMLTISPHGTVKTTPLTAPPDLEALQQTVGGYIEAVPHFKSIEHNGELRKCVAFCNEDGKLQKLAANNQATVLWRAALQRVGVAIDDVLVGTIVVLYGDDEFLSSL